MSRAVLRPAASADLKEIGRFTQRVWGREQRNRYLRQISKRISMLVENPNSGAVRDEIRPGCRTVYEGSHVIIYRVTAQGIDVLRILHRNMDIRRHF